MKLLHVCFVHLSVLFFYSIVFYRVSATKSIEVGERWLQIWLLIIDSKYISPLFSRFSDVFYIAGFQWTFMSLLILSFFSIFSIVEVFQVVLSCLSDTTRQLHGSTCCFWTLQRVWSCAISIFSTLRIRPSLYSALKLPSLQMCLRHDIFEMDLSIFLCFATSLCSLFFVVAHRSITSEEHQ